MRVSDIDSKLSRGCVIVVVVVTCAKHALCVVHLGIIYHLGHLPKPIIGCVGCY